MPRILVAVAFVLLFSNAAAAQSIYTVGALGADISLVSGQQSSGSGIPTGGEAISGAARLGMELAPRFGVEIEFSRAGEIQHTAESGFPVPLAAAAPLFLGGIERRTQLTTITTSASIRQQLNDSVALAFLGGIVFHRTETEMTFRRFGVTGISTIPPLPGLNAPGLDYLSAASSIGFPPRLEGVQYGVGPVVGIEAHIGYGDHLTIVPGVRMHGLSNSWLVRPSAGVGWRF